MGRSVPLPEQLTEDERMIRDTARAYAQDKLFAATTKAYLEEKVDRDIFHEMGELGLIGITLPEEYGCANASYVSYRPGGRARSKRVEFRLWFDEFGAILAGRASDLCLWRREASAATSPFMRPANGSAVSG